MHERPMRDVAAVFQDALVVGAPKKIALDAAEPAAVFLQVVEFGQNWHRRPLGFRQIAKEDPDEAVFFLDRIGVDAGLARDRTAGRVRRDFHALPVRRVFPAMIGTDDAIALHRAARQRCAAMDAKIRDRHGFALGRAKKRKVLARHRDPCRLDGHPVGEFDRIPEILQHTELRRLTRCR